MVLIKKKNRVFLFQKARTFITWPILPFLSLNSYNCPPNGSLPATCKHSLLPQLTKTCHTSRPSCVLFSAYRMPHPGLLT